jgi:hypothetical protein
MFWVSATKCSEWYSLTTCIVTYCGIKLSMKELELEPWDIPGSSLWRLSRIMILSCHSVTRIKWEWFLDIAFHRLKQYKKKQPERHVLRRTSSIHQETSDRDRQRSNPGKIWGGVVWPNIEGYSKWANPSSMVRELTPSLTAAGLMEMFHHLPYLINT